MSSLLRSTKLVRYFTGAARTLILSSSKTTEASLLINPKTLSAANNVLLRDYATSKKKESLEPLLQKIDSEVKRFGRITKRDIDEIFDEIRATNDITSSQSLLVIRCCGELVPEELPEQRTLLVQKIWNVLNERGVPMDVSHYNALLRVYLENEHPFSPALFLEEMEKKGLQPNRVTYQRLMWRYCQEGDVEGATKVLEKMRELNMPVSEPVLNALVMGHAFHGDTEGAKAVLETMAGAGLSPSNRTYGLLACGYAKKGDIGGIENVIATAKDKDILLTDKDLLDVIENLALGGHEDKVDQIFPYLHKGMGYNQEVCILVFKLLNKGLESTARKVIKTMPKAANIEDTMFKGAFYVKHLIKLDIPADKIIQSCRELQSEGLIPSAIYIATEASLQLGKSELALKLFKELQKDGLEIRQHYYWPLLAKKSMERDEEGLLEIVRSMCNEKLIPTGEALRDYIIPCLIKNDMPQNVILKLQIANVPTIHCARNVMVDLLEKGDIKEAAKIALQYRPRGQYSLIARSLMGALNKTKDIKSFTQILHVISSSPQSTQEDVSNDDSQADDTDKSSEVGRIVKSAIKNIARDNLSEELLTSVLSKGLKINTGAAEEIEHYLGNKMTTKISELLAQLTSHDLDIAPIENNLRRKANHSAAELETLIEKLKDKEGANINNFYKQLLNLYIQEKDVDKLCTYLDKLKTSNFELTNTTLAQLYEFFCENDHIEKAKEIEAQLTAKNDYTLNNYKKVLMAYALVRANRYDEAVQFLTENKCNETVNNGFFIKSKSWQLLNTLAEQKDEKKVKEMTKVLIENSYIEPSNIILGPSIKVYILKDDIDGALAEFEHCCKQYRSTPWKGELMKALIMKEDATKLQWVADLSTQIHGEVNILHDLVLAFIECGRLRQARRILETPGLHTRNKRLEDACQRYVDEGKSEYLEGLLEATKELSHIDRSNIFYHLLVTYCKGNETDKALGLWTILQEEGEIPSDQFLTYLGKHLKAKNRTVPFVMPQEAQKAQVTEQPKEKDVSKKQTQRSSSINVTEHIENLINQGNLAPATEYAINNMKAGIIPRTNIIKYLLKKLSEEGNVEKIQEIGKYFNEPMLKKVTHEDKLTIAKFNRGDGAEHVNGLLKDMETANSNEAVENLLKQFPRSAALAKVVQDDDMLNKCQKIVDVAASKGYKLPANLLWMDLILANKNTEANNIWQKYLSNTDLVIFRRLLQESHERKQPENIEKLIELLQTNPKISKASIGNAFSRLINFYISENNMDKAKDCLDRAYKVGLTDTDLNKTTIQRLNNAIEGIDQKAE